MRAVPTPRRRERGGKLARVPIDAIAHQTDHGPDGLKRRGRRSVQVKEASSRLKSISPDWKLSPLSSAVTMIFAGLNSIGSMA